jgi:hypothetical protein
MAGKNMDYWYDEQIKRYLLQVIRIFSHFKVREYTSNGIKYNRVPAKYGDSSRMVASLLRNNSENAVNSAPMIAVTIENIMVARDRAHDPFFVDTKQVAEREWDSDAGQYTSNQGNLYTTQRYMPVPYNMTIKVDIWTTNTDAKLQILEQIFVLFNPSIQLQSNSNPLDWTNVFEIEMTDVSWTSRSVPAGVDETLDIASLTFAVPIWISPPAKVKRQSIIQKIIADIHSIHSIADLGYNSDYDDFFGTIPDTAEVIVTPNDYFVRVDGASATLLDIMKRPQNWDKLIEMQGKLSSVSKLKLNITNDSDNDIDAVIGSVVANPVDPTKLIFNLDADTLPTNTLPAVDRIIDPRLNSPDDSVLPPAVIGQRYLVTEPVSESGYPSWNVDADENDIIEYTDTGWIVVFTASNSVSTQYVTNTYTGKQYKWTGTMWISSHEGVYNYGFWRLIL